MPVMVYFKTFLILSNLVQLSLSEKKVVYDGFSLIRVTPTTDSQLQYLLNLTALPGNELEFWLQTTAVNNSADVMVNPSTFDNFKENLNELNIPVQLLIPDLGKIIQDDLNSEHILSRRHQFFDNYQSFESISQYVRSLASLYSSHATVFEIGRSFEGRPLEILQISSGSYMMKPAIFIQGGAHAREQIGPPTVLYIAYKLASLYYEDEEIYNLVNTFDWYFLPVLNPDGYDYCQKKDRLWRKTRSRIPHSKCVGVDANRNFDIRWNETGSSPRPCSETYAGLEPFSEPETKAVSNFMKRHLRNRFEMFVDFHSYSQRWLTPWGYTSKLHPTYEEQKRLAEIGTSALKAVYGTEYLVGSSGNIMYTVSGGARDWVSKVMGAKYSYVVELRDQGDFGFILPKSQILPTARETWEAIKAMALELYNSNQKDDYEYD